MSTANRSKAAKKGWVTRRKNREKTILEARRLLLSKKKISKRHLVINKKTGSLKGGTLPETDLSTPVITEWFDEHRMGEIYSTGLQFAFVSADGHQCHPFAYCKDFLQDAIWAELNKCKASVYSFVHEYGTNPPVDLKKTRMATRLQGDTEFRNKCLQTLNFMREIDTAQKFTLTELQFGGKYKETSNKVYVFVSDAGWMYSPVMISLYSLFLRVGMTYEGGGWREHFGEAKSYLGTFDKTYTEKVKQALDKIIGQKMESLFADTQAKNYPPSKTKGLLPGMHHNSGIVSYATNTLGVEVKKNWT